MMKQSECCYSSKQCFDLKASFVTVCFDISGNEDDDDLMIAWFELVNEKNDLVRRECDFIYM